MTEGGKESEHAYCNLDTEVRYQVKLCLTTFSLDVILFITQ